MTACRFVFVATILLSCEGAQEQQPPAPNRWSNERLLAVLDAQEHRNTEALCALLRDTSATVRTAAALAFASVQDSASAKCLLQVLSDPHVDVRVNAVYALGFIANDSTVDRMAELSGRERDSTVHRAYLSAMFLNLQRRGKLKDVAPALYYLERSSGQERVRAADALRRLPTKLLLADSTLIMRAVTLERNTDAKAALLRALMQIPGPQRLALLLDAGMRGRPLPMRISAMGALGLHPNDQARDSLLAWMNDPIPAVRTAAIDALHSGGVFGDGGSYWSVLENDHWLDAMTITRLYGLMAYDRGAQKKVVIALHADTTSGPYAEAERIKALSMTDEAYNDRTLEQLMYGDEHAAIRQAAFGVLAERERWLMMMPRAISYDMQVEQAAPFWHRVFGSGDAGLICAAAEKLTGGRLRELKVLFPANVEQQALAALHPLRDLEAIQLMGDLATKRDGVPARVHDAPPFNHKIDAAKLRALKQGQRYRIVTSKGEIIIATDVDQCPGSSLAFDSLVVAGYYNGKAFHRMVPNFVVQGGCPRGDGYGGMPWTLRTEIGRSPFTAGSVGLASAGRDTESCQFFITHSPAPHLDGRYTRFGEVVQGMDVVWELQVGDVMERVEREE
ncbi:MAG TPA: peptidylprolyl isomerase [Flavobacteriales bacterium]|nr:peptidylprolyl isomerase [Flavobacteriales bacterium]